MKCSRRQIIRRRSVSFLGVAAKRHLFAIPTRRRSVSVLGVASKRHLISKLIRRCSFKVIATNEWWHDIFVFIRHVFGSRPFWSENWTRRVSSECVGIRILHEFIFYLIAFRAEPRVRPIILQYQYGGEENNEGEEASRSRWEHPEEICICTAWIRK